METTSLRSDGHATQASNHAPIKMRAVTFDFTDAIPRYWLAGSPRGTHLVNGVNLLFPLGERFFIRSVRAYQEQIEDPELREQVKGFMQQEVRHGIEHERFFATLRAQGYEIDEFLRWYDDFAWKGIEPAMPKAIRLSVTVALEHFTAMLAERALTDGLLDSAHPVMADLLRWHAAEEIEHKAVAFDVLRAVSPSYPVRVAGLVVGGFGLVGLWVMAVRMLMEQDRRAGNLVPEPPLAVAHRQQRELPKRLVKAFFSYLKPSFHPNDHADGRLAEAFFSRFRQPEPKAP